MDKMESLKICQVIFEVQGPIWRKMKARTYKTFLKVQ